VKNVLWLLIGAALLAGGCASVEVVGKPKPSVIGSTAQSVIQDHAGSRIEIFDNEGKQVQELPEGRGGSVSIHRKDQTGQDNYTYDENGTIIKHRRSHGADYGEGKWVDVP